MKKKLESNWVDKQIAELALEIQSISDDRDQQISRAMAVLLRAQKSVQTQII